MIRGYFSGRRRLRPFIDAVFSFPTLDHQTLPRTRFLVDTGTDRTTFIPSHSRLRYLNRVYGFNLEDLPRGRQAQGPAGREIQELPPVLGWDLLAEFGMFLEQRTNRVILLESDEASHFDTLG